MIDKSIFKKNIMWWMMTIQFFCNIPKWQSTIIVCHNLTFFKLGLLLLAISEGLITNYDIKSKKIAQSAGAVEYTDCTSAEGYDPHPHPNECPVYDTKQSDSEVPAVQELWGMRSTPSLPSLPSPLWPRVVAPDKSPIYGSNRTNSILLLKWIVWVNWIA